MDTKITSSIGHKSRLSFTELKAYEWLITSRHYTPADITRGEQLGDPDFIYYGIHGYEIKELNGSNIIFERRQYKALFDWQGNSLDLLVFNHNEDEPNMILPFHKLPLKGGQYGTVFIQFRDSALGRAMISCSSKDKEELEKLRNKIELETKQQYDWADMILQAMYCVLVDQKIMQVVTANRYGVKFFATICPHCQTDNMIQSRPKLYWLIKCKNCEREYVAKNKVG